MKEIDIVSVLFVFVAGLIAYIFGLYVPVLEIDSAQYASISREMLASGNYLQVQHRFTDYLDKPPLLFGLSAFSMKVFGVNSFAFKLPSFLFSILGFYSTYKLATILYNRTVGIISSLILFTTLSIFLFNQDVRTDTILTGAVIFSIWQLTLFIREQKLMNLILGFIGIAAAMLSKGPIGLMVPVLAIGVDLIIKKKWKDIFNYKWIFGLVILAILLFPMSWGLYQQFGWTGVKFFYWTQSFGRITGENVWKNDTGYFFFVHTYLWAFLPWSFAGIIALYERIKILIKSKFKMQLHEEIITLAGFILPFIALSFSKYKLPHYIFVVFPLLSILTAKYLENVLINYKPKNFKFLITTNYISQVIIWAILLVSLIWFFPADNIIIYLIAILLLLIVFFLHSRKSQLFNKLIISLAVSSIALNLILNIHLFPNLLSYQSGVNVARIFNENKNKDDKIIALNLHSHSLDYYSEQIVPNISDIDSLFEILPNYQWLWVPAKDLKGVKSLLKNKYQIYEINNFQVSRLNLKFLNPKTRDKQLERRYLIRIEK